MPRFGLHGGNRLHVCLAFLPKTALDHRAEGIIVKNTEHEGIGFLVVAQVLDHRGMQHGRHRFSVSRLSS
jgi:hypothetical protein